MLDNPFEDYISPDLSITNGEIDGSFITISWQADNLFALEFSHILEPAEMEWSDWKSSTTTSYGNLNEGEYNFIIKSRYEEGNEQETPDSLSFVIDAIEGPGLRFFPLFQQEKYPEAISIEIYAEEVTDLIGAEIEFTYDPNIAVLDTSAFTMGSLFSSTQGQPQLIKEYNLETGYVLLTLATALDDTGLTDSGSLVELQFIPQTTGAFELSFSNACVYVKNTAPNTAISFISLTSGNVMIK